MAKSRYEYVKQFEQDPPMLPHCFMVVRVDGRSFHRFTTEHNYAKPNDLRGLQLMNECASRVMEAFPEIFIAIGQSDEYSFVFKRRAQVYKRRTSKISTAVVSIFSSAFVFLWPKHFGESILKYPPSFDGRIVAYPTEQSVRDYLSWRQVDCHINNLYNTCFWKLVSSGKTEAEAHKALEGTQSSDKNELLFQSFGINYNEEPAIFRKASVLLRDGTRNADGSVIQELHEDIISTQFWQPRQKLLE